MTRGSVRLRLTVLFASLFLASGTGLLGITYGLVSNATNGIIVARATGLALTDGSVPTGSAEGLSGSAGSLVEVPATAGPAAPANLQQLQVQATKYASDTRAREKDALLLTSASRSRSWR